MLIQDRFEIEDGVLKAYTADTETGVNIPEGVHTIGEGVFKGMAWLLDVKLPSTLKKIGPMAFKGCRQLRRMDFPAGLAEIGDYAFHKCHEMEEMILPKTMTKVGNCAFLYCDSLKKAVMEGPISMGKGVFSHNLKLKEIAVNSELDDSNFSDEVFEGCISLRRIILSGQVYEINNLVEAMDSHTDYPGIIKSIAKSVYHSMQIEDGVLNKFSINLKNIVLPEGITIIGKSCFFDKKGIISISLPESVRKIRANAFLNCIGLTDITLGSSDIILDEKAFRGCCNLKKVHMQGKTYLLEEEASDETVGRIRDQILGDFYISGRILVRYMGNEEQIRIPKGVEMIGERCFFKNEQVKTVLCPDGLKEIREQAFAGCVTLQNVVLQDGLKRIEREAFAECKKLLKLNLPATVEYIGEYAFRRCFTLKPFESLPENADIHPYSFYPAKQFTCADGSLSNKTSADSVPPDMTETAEGELIAPYSFTKQANISILKLSGVKRIGKYAYAACPNLEEVIIDSPECLIERNAFSNCLKLKKVRLNVKEIGRGIFSYCRELEEVCLLGVSVLPAESFAGCFSLHKFEAEELTGMEARCFDECVNLDSFDFNGIGVIGERAFERCDSLRSIKLDRTECGYHAFSDCASLESVEFTKNTNFKSGAFIGCTGMHTVIFDGQKYGFSAFKDSLNLTGNPYPGRVREVIASVYSCFDIRERKLLAGYTGDASKITIPKDIEEIGQDVFRDHVRLKEINIPGSVKLFGSHAFTQTSWLAGQRTGSDMVIVNDVLLDGALCKGKVVLPVSVKRVASWCFAGNTEIRELEILSERIAIEALSFRNCLNLKKIIDWNKNEYVLSRVSDLTDKEYPDLILRIFTECINCFKLDQNFNLVESTGNITCLTLPEGIRSVGDAVYKDCHLLETISLSEDTERIGKCAFENSKWLKSVSRAGSVSYIGAQAFSGCQSLESIDLSDELLELGIRCFEHCGSLREIYLSDKLKKIPERAFFRCKSLRKVIIPDSVEKIEDEAFAFCENLEEVYVSVKTAISERAFAYCDNLRLIKKS